jgi:hypothetical protein
MTTTECQPCQGQSLAREDIGGAVPDIALGEGGEWSGPIGMENLRTGDGRLIEANALRWDTLPVPLRWAMQDFGAHDGAYVVGKISAIERLTYDEANERLAGSGRDALPEQFAEATIIWGEGTHDLGSEYGREAFRQADQGLTPGVSMDLDDIVVEESGEELTIKEGRVRAATQVAIPAFEGARISVRGDARVEMEAQVPLAVESSEAFNWVDDVGGLPQYIKRIQKHLAEKGMDESRAIATAVNVVKKMCATGDVNFPGKQEVNAGSRAEACAAVAEWEEKKARARASAGDSLTAGATVFPAEWFEDPRLDGPTGVTVTDDGRVYGHIALWGTCHIASPQGRGVCTQPPRSATNYSYFRTGAVSTTRGEVAVGKITMDTLHAGPKLSSNDTVHHYEHTGSVGAYVAAGEDAHGIWVAGAANPRADHTALKAAPVSGDWRAIGGNLELVGALSVNVPGFPVPRAQALVASGAVQSLVASGLVEKESTAVTLDLSDESALRALRARMDEVDRRDRAAALAARVNRLAALERVRRVRATFAYNPDQWRVPKGNPKGGQWVDMPHKAIDNLGARIGDIFDRVNMDQGKIDAIGESVDQALDAGAEVKDALNANDGPAATAAATKADEVLSVLEAQLDDAVYSAGLEDADAATLGDALAEARDATALVRDSDLTLLGDKGLDGEGSGDIGGEGEGVVGDEPAAPAAPAAPSGRGDAPEGGEKIDLADAPPAVQQAMEGGEDEEYFKSTRWPGMYEARYTDPDTGETIVAAVADPEGNVVGTTSGGGNPYIIYNADGSTGTKTYEDLDSAVRDLPGSQPADGMEGEDPVDADAEQAAGMSDAELLAAIAAGEANPAMLAEAELRGLTGGEEAPAADAAPTPGGSPQQKAAAEATEAASFLEGGLQAAAEFDIPEEDAEAIGDAFYEFQDALDRLTSGVQGGSYKAEDLAGAQSALQRLEAVLMDAADRPGMTDEQANQIGQRLDDVFAKVGALADSLKGSTAPPPFARRSYARQWLGRRGIRLGRNIVTL